VESNSLNADKEKNCVQEFADQCLGDVKSLLNIVDNSLKNFCSSLSFPADGCL
jgi:hypothetical protein